MNYILEHLRRYPSMQSADLIKLVYQSVFGAEHLLTSKKTAEEYLLMEFDQTPPADGRMIEPVSDRYARVHLAVWKFQGRSPLDLAERFYKTASVPSGASDNDFRTALSNALDAAEMIHPASVILQWRQECDAYLAEGIRPVHHSILYKSTECPAYRLISRSLLTDFSV